MFEYDHLSELVDKQAAKYGDKIAMRYRNYTTAQWESISWNQFARTNHQTANALVSLTIQEKENVAIFSQNMPECFYAEYACYMNRAVSVPIYATSSAYQAAYILNDAEVRFLFVGEQQQYEVAFGIMAQCPTLQRLIIFDSKVIRHPEDRTSLYFHELLTLDKEEKYAPVVKERIAKASLEDLANILYTSGTTGEPKGVLLHHSCFSECFRIHDIRVNTLNDSDVSMNFLPLTHVFEKAWSHFCFHKGTQVCINLRPNDIQMTIREIRPTVMCNVPRFWEKVYTGVQEKINSSKGLTKKLMLDAIRTGHAHNVDGLRLGKKPSLGIRLKYQFYEKTIFKLLKKTVGVENGKLFPTAGAAIPEAIYTFVRSVGIPMIAGYGLTESTATVSCAWGDYFQSDSVGFVMPDLEVRIGDNGEVLLRGKTITKGYYKKPKETAAAFDADGWFHTGDIGSLDEKGELRLGERIKDLFKTSNGKYIAPQALENKLVVDNYIDQVAVIADGRKFVSALIVPDYKQLENYARKHGIAFIDVAELLNDPDIYDFYQTRIDGMQASFTNYERIKRFTLLPQPFSMEREELTNTLKLKRHVIARNYKHLIDQMYKVSN